MICIDKLIAARAVHTEYARLRNFRLSSSRPLLIRFQYSLCINVRSNTTHRETMFYQSDYRYYCYYTYYSAEFYTVEKHFPQLFPRPLHLPPCARCGNGRTCVHVSRAYTFRYRYDTLFNSSFLAHPFRKNSFLDRASTGDASTTPDKLYPVASREK